MIDAQTENREGSEGDAGYFAKRTPDKINDVADITSVF